MDNPELIDLFESELDFLISKAHRSGLSFWHILRIVLTRIEGLVMQADAEYWLKGGK
jgi:hypothetical protein